MSKIDPRVRELVAAVWNDAIYETEGRGKSQRRLVKCLERTLTARLRTPGTVEISREAAMHIGHFMRDASHFEVEFDQWVLVEIDAALAQEDTNG